MSVAGSATVGTADGVGAAAQFSSPYQVTVVGSEAYVADGMRLRKVDLGTRAVTTVAGNGTAFCTDAVDPLQAGMVPRG